MSATRELLEEWLMVEKDRYNALIIDFETMPREQLAYILRCFRDDIDNQIKILQDELKPLK